MSPYNIYVLLKDYTKQNLVTKYGIHLAKEINSKAVLLGIGKVTSAASPVIVNNSVLPDAKYLDVKALKKNILTSLQQVRLDVLEIHDQVFCEAAVGLSDTDVVTMTKDKDPFLMVIEAQNELTSFNEWFGTYETKIAEDTDYPVLAVPPKTKWKPVKNILYLMDLDDAKVDNMRTLTTLTQKLDAHLQVIFVSQKDIEEADGSYQQMVSVFKNILGFKEPTYHRIFGANKGSEVAGLVDALAPDWLAFEQKNKNFFERLFDDYNTKRLLLQSDIPTLVF